MKLFPWKKPKPLFHEEDNRLIVKAIRHAEPRTSGEARAFVESRCSWVDAMDRAAEIFFTLAVFGDEGIHKKVGSEYWNRLVQEMLDSFNKKNYGKGVAECVIQIGDSLTAHFPFERDTDRNELPDEIVFGR